MEALKKAVENRKAPFEIEGKAGSRILSLRVSERMEQLLEEQAQEWNMSISDTLRRILNFYFLPPLLMEAWENKVEELVEVEIETFKRSRADMEAPTKAQAMRKVFVDIDESEEYANFIHGLWDKNVKYWELLREEAVAMHEVAGEELLKASQALRKAGRNLEKAMVEQP